MITKHTFNTRILLHDILICETKDQPILINIAIKHKINILDYV